MIFVWPRIIFKIIVFFAILAFLLFFVVYGYRFDNINNEFVPHTASYHIATWDNNQNIIFDGYSQKAFDKNIDIFNIKSGCYDVKKGDKTYSRCFEDYMYVLDTFVRLKHKQAYSGEKCSPIQLSSLHGSSRCIGNSCFKSQIVSHFLIENLGFVQTQDKIYTCNILFEECRLLETDVIHPIVCHSDKGLHSNKTSYILE